MNSGFGAIFNNSRPIKIAPNWLSNPHSVPANLPDTESTPNTADLARSLEVGSKLNRIKRVSFRRAVRRAPVKSRRRKAAPRRKPAKGNCVFAVSLFIRVFDNKRAANTDHRTPTSDILTLFAFRWQKKDSDQEERLSKSKTGCQATSKGTRATRTKEGVQDRSA